MSKQLKLISCNVFQREACLCIGQSPHLVDVEFMDLGEHARPAVLREKLQARIDASESAGKTYDAVLLLFGVCGNATVGLKARSAPLVLPRAHDCCTILLGSRERFVEHFGEAPSTPFSSVGYMERGSYFLRTEGDAPQIQTGDAYAELVRQYGEDDARYIWEQMHPPAEHAAPVFIDLPETSSLGFADRFRLKVLESGGEPRQLQGDIRLIRKLILGQWDEEFLTVPPGQAISGVYDWSEIVRAQ
jgi:hypothetical protein